MTFISRFLHFRIIREFLNSRASIRVVGHFRELKIGALCISCERQINVIHKIAAHAVGQLKLDILFDLLGLDTPKKKPRFFCMLFFEVLLFTGTASVVNGKTSKKSMKKKNAAFFGVSRPFVSTKSQSLSL